ncbi:MAG: hypothetical protein JNL21_00905 [Myxococcales bacterium]|nr:hypothetical protein [Myxococcales bacterium]
MASVEELENELKGLEQEYEAAYTGKDRHTVDLGPLRELIARADKAIRSLESLGALTAGESAATLHKAMTDRKAFFEREVVLITSAKDMGPAFERFASEGTSANFVFDRYVRHFAGQSRDTRDLGLLKELIDELKGIKKRMLAVGGKKIPEALERDVDIVTQNIERYQVEEREIPKAQASGSVEEQADRLAMLANQQFAIYQRFFAGQSRVTRRPGLLVRLIDNLKRYRSAMFELKNKGLNSEANVGNIGIVDGRLQAYEKELAEIRKVRSQVKLSDIMGSLGGSANELFEEYRRDFAGKDRTSVSLEQLFDLVDKLDEIRRQMEELGRVEKNETNAKNLVIVRDYQGSWVREFQSVKAAQSNPALANPALANPAATKA